MDDDCTARDHDGWPPGDYCDELLVDCRLRAATELFAHTWDPLVLVGLRPGPRRRADLHGTVGGISDKVLTDTLRRLLANGLVVRRSYPAAPPRVEYGLSALGASLVDGPMRELGRWTLAHGEELLEAQERAAGTGTAAATGTATA
jgi:DNA-binding HxlR family transcriptional regulator